MTSARAFDGGSYSPYSETPIYDRLVAERGRPEIGPMNVPAPDFTGLGHYSRFGDRPALPALPALPSSNSNTSSSNTSSSYGGSSYGGSTYGSPSGYSGTPSYGVSSYTASPYANAGYTSPGYAPAPPAPLPFSAQQPTQYVPTPQPQPQYGQPLPQGYRPAPGAPQGYRPAPGSPQQYGGQVPPPRVAGRPESGGFQDRH